MGHTASAHPRLAHAFLALADDAEAAPPQRSAPRAVAAVAAALVLSLAAPLAWTSAAAGKPADLPAAAHKAHAPSPEAEDDPDADGPPGGDTLGGAAPWAATDA